MFIRGYIYHYLLLNPGDLVYQTLMFSLECGIEVSLIEHGVFQLNTRMSCLLNGWQLPDFFPGPFHDSNPQMLLAFWDSRCASQLLIGFMTQMLIY